MANKSAPQGARASGPWPITRLCLVSPLPPPYGGMAIQAQKLANGLRQSGLDVQAVPTNPLMVRGWWPSRIPGLRTVLNLGLFLWSLHRALRGADAVYFLSGFYHFFFWVTVPAMLLIRLHGVPVILSARGGDARRFFEANGRFAKPAMRLADCVTTPSGFLQHVFEAVLGSRPVVVPNIADFGQFTFRLRERPAPRLLVTRNLEPIYDVATVLRAVALVRQEHPDVRLSVAGAGSQEAELKALAKELDLDGSVTFLGQLPHHAIAPLYQEHDVYVNASRVDNLPGSILEAFASGLPVVSTRAGGIPYLVEDGKNGLLVDLGDHKALARGVLRLLGEPGLAAGLARQGLEKSREFTWEFVEPVLKEVFAACHRRK